MVKPVELQDNLSKTQLLEKVQQLHKSTPEEAQKKFAQELQKKVSEGKERVADLPKSDKIIIQHDEKKGKDDKDDKEKRKKGKTKRGEKPETTDDDNNPQIDYIA